MPTRKSKEKNIRNLAKIGGKCIGLTLPIEIVRKLKWRERQKVVVSLRGRKISIQDWKN